MSGEKPREIAVEVLGRSNEREFTEDLLERALAKTSLPPVDRRLCQELVYGITRWQAALDWLIGRKTQNRPQKPALQNLLRLGLYQIFWLERVPNHAAVHVTVELAKRRGFGPQAGFINAVLRGYLREFDSTRALLEGLKQSQPGLGYSHPEWLAKRWRARWGEEKTRELLAWNNTPPKTFARINTLKIQPEKLLPIWREENVEYDFVRKDWFEDNLVFELKSCPPLHRLSSFQQGFFYIQDPSTLMAVRELDPHPGQDILDLCAAPGGKLTYIAQLMGNQGRVVGHDMSPERLGLLQENCSRLGVTCAQLLSPDDNQARPAGSSLTDAPKSEIRNPKSDPQTLPIAHSSLRVANIPHSAFPISHSFDRVLVDAPCSNTGVMRRRVDLRWRVKPQEIERLRKAQLDLLLLAASLTKNRGTIVYSTCSLEPEENRQVIDVFLSENPKFELAAERELLPFEAKTDGAYVARLISNRE